MSINAKYTKTQILESIKYWQNKLNELEDAEILNIKIEVIDDIDKIKVVLPDIIDLIIKTYKPIGEYYGRTDINSLTKTTSLVKIVRNDSNDISSCSFYRNVNGSFKIQAYGNDGTRFGKNGVKAIIKSDMAPYDNWIWGEVSGNIEKYCKKFQGYPLPNIFVPEVLKKNPNVIELLDDGFHYKRTIGDNKEPSIKVIYGFPSKDVANKAFEMADYEIRRHILNMGLINESGSIPSTFEGACSFVDQLYDMYDEERWCQLTPGLSSMLDASIEILKNNIDREKWVKMTYEQALLLKNEMPKIELFKASI